jgi:hypothetical protein
MVIRTEYRGQRYSMGSSDPLPAGFEIRFGGLNFQATGNGYLMHLTNHEELRVRRQAGPVPVAAAHRRDTSARQHGCCGSIGATAPSSLRPAFVTSAVGAPACSTHRLTMRRAQRRDDSRPTGERSVSGPRFPIGLHGATTA